MDEQERGLMMVAILEIMDGILENNNKANIQ